MSEKEISFRTFGTNSEHTLVLLEEIAKKLNISSLTVSQTINLFGKSLENGILKGRSRRLVLLSSLYVICRQSSVPISLHEIAHFGGVGVRNLARCARILIHSLDLNCGSYDYSNMVNRISDKLKLRDELRKDAINFLMKINEKGVCVGKRPLTIAASVVYISCKINKERKPLWLISEVSGTHNVTIRNNAKYIFKLLDVESNPKYSYSCV